MSIGYLIIAVGVAVLIVTIVLIIRLGRKDK